MLPPLSKLQNHTQFCTDLGEQVRTKIVYRNFRKLAEQSVQEVQRVYFRGLDFPKTCPETGAEQDFDVKSARAAPYHSR
jgi:hypothetical protein